MHRLTALLLSGVMLGLMAACASAPPSDQRRTPTVPAPTWRAASVPITLENANQIAYLGRLDQEEPAATVFAHAMSPDGLNIAGLTDQNVIGWDLLTGERIFVNARLTTGVISYSSDKTEIYGIDSTGDLRVLDATSGSETDRAHGHPAYAGVYAIATDFDLIALGGTDGTVKVWNMVTRQSEVTFDAGEQITALGFSPDASVLATADSDGYIRLWDWATRTQQREWRNEQLGSTRFTTTRIVFSPDGQQFALANDFDVRLGSPTGELSNPLRLETGGRSPMLRYAPDGRYLVMGTNDAGIALWTPAAIALIATLPDTSGDRMDAVFSPDGGMLATTALGRHAALWNISQVDASGGGRFQFPIENSTILETDWTSDGRLILLFDANGAIYAWGIPPAP
ncbi:MAG: WD40 repeat domain-containing protein [Anaerolineae bacterium]